VIHLLRRLLKPLVATLALFLVFEEWLWDHLKAFMRRLADHAWVRHLEAYLRRMPPWASLLVLLLPGALLLPFKVAGLWAIAHGYPLFGLLIFVLAKLSGTALAAYLFDLVRENARKLAWFDRLYLWVTGMLQRARAWLAAQPAYLAAQAWGRRIKAQVREWLA
jgi:hypothetical protein